jgi:hypothetical protein
MSTQFAFRADQVTVSMPEDANIVEGNNSFFALTTQPAADSVSDAVNNVRFACNGFAEHEHGAVLFTLRTNHTFVFQPQAEGFLRTAHAHFMPQGGFSLVARKPTSWFGIAGSVLFQISMGMRVRVLAANGDVVFRAFRRHVNIFATFVQASSVSETSEGAVDADLLDFTRSRSVGMIVTPSDTVEVQARYKVQVMAAWGAEFLLDFASVPAIGGDPGDGLNAPFAVINIAE